MTTPSAPTDLMTWVESLLVGTDLTAADALNYATGQAPPEQYAPIAAALRDGWNNGDPLPARPAQTTLEVAP